MRTGNLINFCILCTGIVASSRWVFNKYVERKKERKEGKGERERKREEERKEILKTRDHALIIFVCTMPDVNIVHSMKRMIKK